MQLKQKSDELQKFKELSKDVSVLCIYDKFDSQLREFDKFLEDNFKKIYRAQSNHISVANSLKRDIEDIDLVFIDTNNSASLYLELQKHSLDLTLLSLVRLIDSKVMLDALSLGVDGFLTMPVTSQSSIKTLTKALKNIKSRKIERLYSTELESAIAKKSEELQRGLIEDDLTNLSNITKLNIKLSSNQVFCGILIDIDSFDTINLAYGYEIGDEVLEELAWFLKKIKPFDAELYRVEGDKFIYLFEHCNREDAINIASSIKSAISNRVFFAHGVGFNLSFSISIAQNSSKKLILDLKIAIKEARESSKNRIHFYSGDSIVENRQKRNLQWSKKIQDFISSDNIPLYFEPIVDNRTLKIYMYETLLNIKKEESHPLYSIFVDGACELKLLSQLSYIVAKKSFEIFSQNDLPFSIDLSSSSLRDINIVKTLEKLLENYNIMTQRVSLEVSESVLIHASKDMLHRLQSLKRAGFMLAINNFRGFRLDAIKTLELEVDYIKIDPIFIKDIDKNQKNINIVKIIKNIAKDLDAKCIARDVSSKSIYDIVIELGIEYSQGLYFYKPSSSIESLG